MASRRDQIKMSDAELAEFLAAERIVNVATNGRDGWPHLTALWYVPHGGDIWIYTYAKSQKVKNLERDPRATLLIEAGHEYQELRGAMLECDATIHRDIEIVYPTAEQLTLRYAQGVSAIEGAGKDALMAQALKRVAVQFAPRRIATWDHSKLGGVY